MQTWDLHERIRQANVAVTHIGIVLGVGMRESRSSESERMVLETQGRLSLARQKYLLMVLLPVHFDARSMTISKDLVLAGASGCEVCHAGAYTNSSGKHTTRSSIGVQYARRAFVCALASVNALTPRRQGRCVQ